MATGDARQPSTFGTLLKHFRVSRGLTQEDVAERAGVSARLVSDLERGVIQRPRRVTAHMLADAFELTGPERERFLDARRDTAAPHAVTHDDPHPEHGFRVWPPGALIGRERELAALIATLTASHHRLVTLTGMGGVGKTRLALEATRLLSDTYPGGLYLFDLTPVRDETLMLPAIAGAGSVQVVTGI
jgi:transcriptional regulator with XRE-family HTH domain